MQADCLPTRHAPAERLSAEEILRQTGRFAEDSLTKRLLDAVPNVLVILNRQRQIIYANQTLLQMVGFGVGENPNGLRPGEVMGCVNADQGTGGCGTAEACRACGMITAILSGLAGREDSRECRILRREADGEGLEALDLRVWATPIEFQGELFTIFAISDISHEKRRSALERIFFHDILNLAGGIKGFAEMLLAPAAPVDAAPMVELIHTAAGRIVEEISNQRLLVAAENRELRLAPKRISALEVLEEVGRLYRHHEVGRERNLQLAAEAENVQFVSDPALVGRVIGNMVKNALEATPAGGTVTLDCVQKNDAVEFRVHNTGCIPALERTQIFQRSFSTKGQDRGLGTYSMRLLTEGYLGGTIAFSSSEAEGTTFVARYPLRFPKPGKGRMATAG